MAIVLWSALNLLVGLGTMYLFFRAAQLLKERMGWGAALFFGFTLLAISCGKTNKESTEAPAQNLLHDIPNGTPLGNGNSLQRIPLAFNTVQILAEYRSERGAVKPRGLFVTMVGFTLGHDWQPVAGTLVQQGQQLRYTATLLHKWRLLNIVVYSKQDLYEGLMPINHP